MKSRIKKNFEEEYFHGRYKQVIGSFSYKELEINRRWFYAWIEKLHHYIPIKDGKGKSVLEIGCAMGGLASLFADRKFDVTASDISHYVIDGAKKLSPHIEFKVFDVQEEIPLQKKFDMIVAIEVMEHLHKPERAMNNMYSKLKPGGFVVFTTPYPYSWAWNDPTHIQVQYPNYWMNLMRQTGFKDVSYHKFSLLPMIYKLHQKLQVVFPFHIPVPFINNPIFYIGQK